MNEKLRNIKRWLTHWPNLSWWWFTVRVRARLVKDVLADDDRAAFAAGYKKGSDEL